MMIVISSAKTLNFERKPVAGFSQAVFTGEASLLVDRLKLLSPEQLSDMMDISPKLAQLNYDRYAAWTDAVTKRNGRQSVYAFDGDVYDGLDAYSLTKRDITFAQKHLCILSGLYGLLRPLDLILPHRLEMGTDFYTLPERSLYNFWNHRIAGLLLNQMEESHDHVLINLASKEYYKSVSPYLKQIRVITPLFKEKHEGEFKQISIYAKKARGLMSRFIIQHRISSPNHIKAFSDEGYLYNPSFSSGDNWVFTRG